MLPLYLTSTFYDNFDKVSERARGGEASSRSLAGGRGTLTFLFLGFVPASRKRSGGS